MSRLPPNHPHRQAMADEVHARPPEALETPSSATCVAVLVDPARRGLETAHLAHLCETFGVAPPEPGAIHFVADLGRLRLRWERHGEFSTYTAFAPDRSQRPFSEPPTSLLPEDWLAVVPGAVVFAGHAKILPRGAVEPDAAFLAEHFGSAVVVGARIGGGAAVAFTDFRLHDDGYSRFLVIDASLTARQAGRTVQRLFEIETYRMMAMLALPVAREQLGRIAAIERDLATLTDDIARRTAADETLLASLTSLAAEVEKGLASTQFRFGACVAYQDLVARRIGELRERRLTGVQTIEEFMGRRFTPAMATCASASHRLHDLSERVAQASALLTTRVEIARERQNQALLESMNRRAILQMRLQQTVEILSVAPITYCVVAIIGYAARAAKAAGAPIDTDLTEGAAVPVVAAALIAVMVRLHHQVFGQTREGTELEL
jgi:uncharacterized membrane-anchored protein